MKKFKEKKFKDNKKLFEILIPVILAVFVVSGFAISGHITRNLDADKPTDPAKETQTEEQTEPAPVNAKATLVAVGDNLIHNTLITSGQMEDGTEDYTSFYKQIKNDISAADIAVIDQETILGGEEFEYTGYPVFNTPWAVGDAAIDAGFDVFLCATNHTMDKGFKGIQNECTYFDKHPEVKHVGSNDTEEDYNSIVYTEANGIKFAILNYTYGTNGIPLPNDKPWCVNMMDKEKITADVNKAKGNCDIIVVFPHWGTENSTSVSDYQKDYVKLFSDLGVDIVIGGHPHVLQPIEWVVNEQSGKKMLVYYSLGNFISHQLNLNQLCGGMAKIVIEKNSDGVTVKSAKLVPVVSWYQKINGKWEYSVYKLSDYTDEIANTHAQISMGTTPANFKKYVKEVIAEEFIEMK
ncbi:MAG: CapA family protein [Eubacterium sp.]|nr:CapA family protein [Eubacterium sp.]